MQQRTMPKGSIEYLDVVVTADVTLTQPVEISLDRENWLTAEWLEDAKRTRTARVLIDTNTLDKGSYAVCIRITDSPEAPILPAGVLKII